MGQQLGEHIMRTARTTHPCTWCGQSILPTEQYYSWAWADNGTVDRLAAHAECYEAMGTLSAYDLDDGWEHGAHCRGCACPKGECECKTAPAPADTEMP